MHYTSEMNALLTYILNIQKPAYTLMASNLSLGLIVWLIANGKTVTGGQITVDFRRQIYHPSGQFRFFFF